MVKIKSPTNYNEMLGRLNTLTFITTLVFFVGLRYFNLIPLIDVDKSLIPPLKEYKELIEWILSFGGVPFFAAAMAYFLSHSFEIHNIISKALLIRYFWDKFFIVKPMLDRSGSDININDVDIEDAMNKLYYPEVKNIDQHYVHLFWRYALRFWVLFEHTIVVLTTAVILKVLIPDNDYTKLYYYGIVITIVTFLQLFMVTVQKSKAQANQVDIQAINNYFMKIQRS